jgi:hypothetical protein
MPGSVSIKSTGQKAASSASTDMRMDHADPSSPHPTAPKGNPGMGPTVTKGEYREVPSPGITQTGVGNLACNDAACEQVNKHPSGPMVASGVAAVMHHRPGKM